MLWIISFTVPFFVSTKLFVSHAFGYSHITFLHWKLGLVWVILVFRIEHKNFHDAKLQGCFWDLYYLGIVVAVQMFLNYDRRCIFVKLVKKKKKFKRINDERH